MKGKSLASTASQTDESYDLRLTNVRLGVTLK